MCPISSDFPKFWTELDEDPNDLVDVMSVLTVLGFKTKSSLSSIKSTRIIDRLEADYAKMRSNKPHEMFTRYPALEKIDFFSPGMKKIILDAALTFSNVPINANLEKSIQNKVLRLLQKVSFKIR